MAKVNDICTFLKDRKETDAPTLVASATDDVSQSELMMVENEVKKSTQVRKHYNKIVPETIKREAWKYALLHRTKVTVERFNKVYPKCTFVRTTINNWKLKMKKEKDGKTIFKKKGRPNLVSDDFMKKIKTIMIGTRTAGTAISRRIVMTIGNGVVRSNSPTLLKENGGSLELTENWVRGVIRSMNWTKRKGTTAKIEPSKQFLLEEKLTFQKKISGVIFEHDISKELIINLDQTPLSYVSPGKYTFDIKGVKTIPIKGIDDKRQITATFAISMSGEFLPIQVIYEGKTKRCLPKYTFPASFDATFSENHWSNTEKSLSFFNEIVFPHFKNVRKAKGYPDEQMSLIIMDTFKGQDNDEVAKLCRKNNCALISVPHNLANKFQPLDITVNKPAKSFIKDK